MTNATASGSGDLGDLLSVLGRRLAVIVLAAAAAAGAAVAISLNQPEEYEASSTLLFRDTNISELVTGVSTGNNGVPERNAATNLGLISLGTVAARTARTLGGTWTASRVSDIVTAESEGQSDLVAVTATSRTAQESARVANAYANAFVDLRRRNARSQIERARGRILAELESEELTTSRRRQLTRDADDLQLLSSVQDGSVQLVEPALAPVSPASPNPQRDGVIGGLIGLLIGIALAFLLEQLDKRLRRPRDAERAFGLPVLASIRRSRSLRRGTLDPSALKPGDREAFRRLRASLRHLRPGREVRTVVVTSPEAGSGASTVAAGLAATAARANARTLLIEADGNRPRLRRVVDSGAGGLVELLHESHVRLDEAVTHVSLNGRPDEGFDALLADHGPSDLDLLDSPRMEQVLQEARDAYDFVVIDAPPVTHVSDAIPLLRQADGVVVVSRLRRHSAADAERLNRVLADLDIKPLGVVATFARRRDGNAHESARKRRR